MELTREPGILVQASSYRLQILDGLPRAKVWSSGGEMLAELFLLSSCHQDCGRDVSGWVSGWEIVEKPGSIVLRFTADSTVWLEKVCALTLFEDRIVYSVSVRGQGRLQDVELLSGYYTGAAKRWGNARFYSQFHADSLFNPEPNCDERYIVSPWERSLIDLTGVPISGRDHWFFTPPPFCFVLRKGERCMTLGVTASAGKHTFTEYEYTGGPGQGLILRYEGYTQVDGEFSLPEVQMVFGQDEYELLAEFSKIERMEPSPEPRPAWWSKPIVCGWGEQCVKARKEGMPAPSFATQVFYEDLSSALDERGLDPGILVIDDKWQGSYGLNNVDETKWTDLKGFIRRMHDKRCKVLLWLKAWDPEGVDGNLCIRDHHGAPQTVDPENPLYRNLFQEAAFHLLSSEGLDADGFKIDFTARIPTCPGCVSSGPSWGLELMRAYLALVYDSAKRAKEDALVMCHCPHPYLGDKLDMIRLNDVNTARPVVSQMTHRARVAKAALPGTLIDTDNWPMPNKSSWLEYIKAQPDLGIPSLYYLCCIDSSDESITDTDLDVVRKAWKKWEAKNYG